MTDAEYMKRLIFLSVKLEQAGQASPYDPDAYNIIIDQLNALCSSKGKLRRRCPSLMFYIICFLILILLFILWGIIRPV